MPQIIEKTLVEDVVTRDDFKYVYFPVGEYSEWGLFIKNVDGANGLTVHTEYSPDASWIETFMSLYLNDIANVTVTSRTQAAGTIKIVSDEVGDTGVIRVFAVDAANNITVMDITLNGTTEVSSDSATAVTLRVGTGVDDLTEVFGMYYVSGTVTGTITLEDDAGTSDLISVDMGTNLSAGALTLDPTAVPEEFAPEKRALPVSITNSNGAAIDEYIVFGKDPKGNYIAEHKILVAGTKTTTALFREVLAVMNLTSDAAETHNVSQVDANSFQVDLVAAANLAAAAEQINDITGDIRIHCRLAYKAQVAGDQADCRAILIGRKL